MCELCHVRYVIILIMLYEEYLYYNYYVVKRRQNLNSKSSEPAPAAALPAAVSLAFAVPSAVPTQ